jgi:hypothetical protein
VQALRLELEVRLRRTGDPWLASHG